MCAHHSALSWTHALRLLSHKSKDVFYQKNSCVTASPPRRRNGNCIRLEYIKKMNELRERKGSETLCNGREEWCNSLTLKACIDFCWKTALRSCKNSFRECFSSFLQFRGHVVSFDDVEESGESRVMVYNQVSSIKRLEWPSAHTQSWWRLVYSPLQPGASERQLLISAKAT